MTVRTRSIIAAVAAVIVGEAAFVNFRLMASDVWSTAQAVKTIASLK